MIRNLDDFIVSRPTLGQMFGRIKVIAQREGYELSDASLNQILENCQGDMRSSYLLEVASSDNCSFFSFRSGKSSICCRCGEPPAKR